MEVLEKITLTIPRARKLVKQLASVLKGLEADVESPVSRGFVQTVWGKPEVSNLQSCVAFVVGRASKNWTLTVQEWGMSH